MMKALGILISVLSLTLAMVLSGCTTHHTYNYYGGEVPTANVEEQKASTDTKEVVIIGQAVYSIGEQSHRLTTQANKNVGADVPTFNALDLTGDVEFLVDDLATIVASGNLIINVKYNTVKNFDNIVLRVYTLNAEGIVGLVGDSTGQQLPIGVVGLSDIPNQLASASLFDYLELDSWGDDPRALNPRATKAIKISDMVVQLQADFSEAISQHYSTILVFEIAGTLAQ